MVALPAAHAALRAGAHVHGQQGQAPALVHFAQRRAQSPVLPEPLR
jgi:hypothetical protein